MIRAFVRKQPAEHTDPAHKNAASLLLESRAKLMKACRMCFSAGPLRLSDQALSP